MEISLSNFTVAASSHSGEGGDTFGEKTKPLAELNDLGVHAKKHVSIQNASLRILFVFLS